MRLLSTIVLFIILSVTSVSNAQNAKILALDTFIGAANGTGLGLATMALNNSADLGPLRIGAGAGTIYGLGLGIYDVTQSAGSGYMINGALSSASNSAQIVAMDTFYGSITGGLVGFAISLIGNSDLVDGLQYGSGVGAWTGFGFGLIDAFIISKGGSGYDFSDDGGYSYGPSPIAQSKSVSGIIQVDFNNGTQVGFVNPSVVQTRSATSYEVHPAIQFTNINVNF